MALARKILAHHLVWKEGDSDKVEASSIVGLIPPPPKHSYASAEMTGNVYAPPVSGNISDGPPGGPYLPHLHPANFALYLATVAGTFGIPAVLFSLSPEVEWNASNGIFLCMAGLCFLTWISLSLIYLHRSWSMMRSFGASLTGGRAVRYLVIPFFNALWCFVALFGWSRLWNENVRNHPGMGAAGEVWTGAFFLFPILFLVSQGLLLMHLIIQEWPVDLSNPQHLVSLGVWLATLVVLLVCWGQMSRAINFLARKKF